jgi:subtilisin family serine protease
LQLIRNTPNTKPCFIAHHSGRSIYLQNQPVHSLQVPTRPRNIIQSLKDGQPWGIDLVDGKLDRKYNYTYSGNGVKVFVFDTGIMSNHDEFWTGQVTCGLNTIEEEICDDLKGHGTHIAATVGGKTYGLARQVSLINVKVLDKNGTGSVANVLKGLEYVAKQKSLFPATPMIVGLSLGSNKSMPFNDAITRCVDAGIVVVAASGNEQVDACTMSPGSAEKAIIVGAIDITLLRPIWSNYGDCVNLYAPAVAILSATYDSKDRKKTTYRSGTSMAVPHVVGVVAMYLEWNPNLTPNDINDYLMKDSTFGILLNLDIDLDDDKNDANNLLISSAKVQMYQPNTLAPTISPTRITDVPSESPSGLEVERGSCSSILSVCVTDDDCCFSCLRLDWFNLGIWGQRCFWFG